MTERVALAYSFGVESDFIYVNLLVNNISPLLILCYAPMSRRKTEIEVRRMFVKEKNGRYPKRVLLNSKFEEEFYVKEDFHPEHFFHLGGNDVHHKDYVFTNTILEWAKQQPTKPFDTLYLGRKLEDLDFDPTAYFDPPAEAFGFKLRFPLWKWKRKDKELIPPEEGYDIPIL